ncbi:MAG TPA: phospho-N-acetylmuramoyl-pentapeptide-transferase, partial [Candidatus Binataceae bacterium]
ASALAATILLANILNPYIWLSIFITVGFGAVGFADDYFKLVRGRGLGLSGPTKLFWLLLLAFLASFFLFAILKFDTQVTVPFAKNAHRRLPWWLYVPCAMVVIVGCSNAVNLTDGLDGLAIGPVMTVAFTYWVFTYVAGNLKFATYLQIPHVVGVGELAIFCASLIAASLGFLWYNAYPASMMMGDVGALSLGGAIGMVAILAKQELALVIAGGVFVLEALSVILQRYYYKATHKRFFRMAPLHHHFELQGWPETVVVVRFWILSIVCALVALSTLKLR